MDEKQQAEGGQPVPVEFNLSDPEQLAHQLEKVDLTEEESDELLREAYKVNKQLKMILQQKQDNVAASLRSQSADSRLSQRSGLKVLPPINSRGAGAVPQRSLKAYGQSTPASAKPQSKVTKPGKTKAAAQRPGWDDRFSYS